MKKAAGVLIIKDGLVFAFHRSDGQGTSLPCGKVDDGETTTLAAIRECLEETGASVVLCGEPYVGTHGKFEVTTYRAVIVGFGQPTHSSEGIPEWVEPEMIFDGVFGEYNRIAYDVLSRIDVGGAI